MRSFCEVIASEVLPSFRSIITKELIDTHDLTQKEVADLLGITQPAVSQYIKESRGLKVRSIEKHPEIMPIINDIVNDLINQNHDKKIVGSKVCRICRKVRENNLLDELKNTNHQCYLEI